METQSYVSQNPLLYRVLDLNLQTRRALKIGQKEGLCSPEIVGVRPIGGHKRDIYKIHKGLVRTLDFFAKAL